MGRRRKRRATKQNTHRKTLSLSPQREPSCGSFARAPWSGRPWGAYEASEREERGAIGRDSMEKVAFENAGQRKNQKSKKNPSQSGQTRTLTFFFFLLSPSSSSSFQSSSSTAVMQRSLARNARVGVVVSGGAPSVRPVASAGGAPRGRGCEALANAPSPRVLQLAPSSLLRRRRSPSLIARASEDGSNRSGGSDDDEKVRDSI